MSFAEVIVMPVDDLARFLQMARKSLREPRIDAELARKGQLHDVDDFLGMTNVADILVGEDASKMHCISLLSYCSRVFPIGHALQCLLSIWVGISCRRKRQEGGQYTVGFMAVT